MLLSKEIEKAKSYAKKMGWEYISYSEDFEAHHVKCAGITGLVLPRLLILEGNKLVPPGPH